MRFLSKAIDDLLAIPVGLLLVALAVANRHFVAVRLDPFHSADASLGFELPLFIIVFLALFVGILLGGFATWISQGKWRRLARQEARQIRKLERDSKSGVPALVSGQTGRT